MHFYVKFFIISCSCIKVFFIGHQMTWKEGVVQVVSFHLMISLAGTWQTTR